MTTDLSLPLLSVDFTMLELESHRETPLICFNSNNRGQQPGMILDQYGGRPDQLSGSLRLCFDR